MARTCQMIQNQETPKVHQNGVSSLVLRQYDLDDRATNKLDYHYLHCIFYAASKAIIYLALVAVSATMLTLELIQFIMELSSILLCHLLIQTNSLKLR
jgi:hypothetical protein